MNVRQLMSAVMAMAAIASVASVYPAFGNDAMRNTQEKENSSGATDSNAPADNRGTTSSGMSSGSSGSSGTSTGMESAGPKTREQVKAELAEARRQGLLNQSEANYPPDHDMNGPRGVTR